MTRDVRVSVCECVCARVRAVQLGKSVCVCLLLDCSSKLHVLLSSGASDKFLSLWPFSSYYCVKLTLSINTDKFVVCSFTWCLHFFSLVGLTTMFAN